MKLPNLSQIDAGTEDPVAMETDVVLAIADSTANIQGINHLYRLPYMVSTTYIGYLIWYQPLI